MFTDIVLSLFSFKVTIGVKKLWDTDAFHDMLS